MGRKTFKVAEETHERLHNFKESNGHESIDETVKHLLDNQITDDLSIEKIVDVKSQSESLVPSLIPDVLDVELWDDVRRTTEKGKRLLEELELLN